MPRYERARSLFGYNDDSDALDTEEEAAVASAEGFTRFGREPRCDVRWAQNHSRSCEFIMPMMQRWYNMHSHCFILYSFSCILFATGASKIVYRVGTFAQFAHRLLQGDHTRIGATGRATHHAAPVVRNVLLIGVLRV